MIDLTQQYRKWVVTCSPLGSTSWNLGTSSGLVLVKSPNLGALWTSAYTACLWAVFEASTDADNIFRVLVTTDAEVEATARADLAVRADQLQAAGDERGEWLAGWLIEPGEHRDRAALETSDALSSRMEVLITQAQRRGLAELTSAIDYAQLERNVMNHWSEGMLSYALRGLHGTARAQRLALNMPARHGMSMYGRNFSLPVHDEVELRRLADIRRTQQDIVSRVAIVRADSTPSPVIRRYRLSLESVQAISND